MHCKQKNKVMGYTHYWNFKNKVAPAEIENGRLKWELAVNKVKEALAYVQSKGIEIAGWDGTGKPIVNTKEISFNGAGQGRCETMYISYKDGSWSFCKTERKPYDLLVCLTLLAFKDAFGDDFEYTSDGITKEDYEDRENNEYWKKINFVPKGPEKEWQDAYDAWEEINA